MGRVAMTPIRRLTGLERMYLALESPTTPMHFGALVTLERDERSERDAAAAAMVVHHWWRRALPACPSSVGWSRRQVP